MLPILASFLMNTAAKTPLLQNFSRSPVGKKLGVQDLWDMLGLGKQGGGAAGSGMAGIPGGGTTGGGNPSIASDQYTSQPPSGVVTAGAGWRPQGNGTQGNYFGAFETPPSNVVPGSQAGSAAGGLYANPEYTPAAPADNTVGGGITGPGGNNVGKGGPGAQDAGKMNPILKSFLDALMKRVGNRGEMPQYSAPQWPGRSRGMTLAGY